MSNEPPPGATDLAAEAAGALLPRFRGTLIGPNDAGYHEARRLWNGRFDRRPALIARCRSPADVMDVVRFARGRDIPVSVRSGSHDLGGHSVLDQGLVIDLTLMKGLRIDPVRRTGRAEAGVLWREFTREAQAFGLAACGAVDPDVSVTGYGIGGGQNLMQRHYGLGCDNVVSIDLVTADGSFLTASESGPADLFWAMRGAGANLGVVTSIEYRLHPVQTVLGGKLVYALGGYSSERAREILACVRDFNASAPDHVVVFIYLVDDPAVGPSISLTVCSLAPVEDSEALLRPLRSLGPPAVDTIAPISYADLQNMFDSRSMTGGCFYYRSHFLKQLDDVVVDKLCDAYATLGASGFGVLLEPMDGAVRRVDRSASAYPERAADYCLLLASLRMDFADSEIHFQQVRDVSNALESFCTGRAYVNYLDSDELDRVPTAYGREIYDRLRAIKNKYDPTNFFRANQNIRAQ